MKTLSTHAHAAKLIRQELKALGIPARVKADSFAGGSSVDIYLTDAPKDINALANTIGKKYQYGHFDGMTDCYEYSNKNGNLPQVKYVHITNEMSGTKKQEIWENVRRRFGLSDTFPLAYTEAQNMRFQHDYICAWVWREFCNPSSTSAVAA